MTTRVKSIFSLFLFASTHAIAQSEARSFAHWIPRNLDDDVKDPADADFLRFLVQNATNRQYTLTSHDGDGLDAIIMREFLVTGNAPIAFGIYKTEILRRNAAKADLISRKRVLIGDSLDFPSGPQFSGLAVPDLTPSQYASELSMAFLKPGNTPESFKAVLVRSGKAFTAYSTAPANDSAAKELAFLELLRRRVVPSAINTLLFPIEKLSHFDIVQLISLASAAPVDARHKVWSEFMPASSQQEISCNNVCLKASDILSVPSITSPFSTRLVLADSGFSVPQNLLAPDARLVSVSGRDYSDEDPQKHGTFNFNEVTTPLGPIPPKALVIAKLERKARADEKDESDQSVEWVWDLTTLDTSIQKAADRKHTGVWIFNISAAGAQKYPINPYAEASQFLFVAAAGNESRPDLHSVPYAFATDRSAFNNILIVGALDQNGIPFTPASYSNHDMNQVDIFARGSCVCGGLPQISGTSQAAPLVSSAAFILASENKYWGAQDIKWSLISTSDIKQDLDKNPKVALPRDYSVGGVLNLARARKTNPIVITSTNAELEASAFQFPSTGEIPWNSLVQKAGSSHSVLRLHRARCAADSPEEWACFERFVQGEPVEPADSHHLSIATPLRIQLVAGGTKDLSAGDIFNVIFPISFPASKKLLQIVPK